MSTLSKKLTILHLSPPSNSPRTQNMSYPVGETAKLCSGNYPQVCVCVCGGGGGRERGNRKKGKAMPCSGNYPQIYRFMLCLSVCNTIKPSCYLTPADLSLYCPTQCNYLCCSIVLITMAPTQCTLFTILLYVALTF